MSWSPSFRYMGGKSRLRKWLVSYFPKSGNKYIEPFCGLGNVFYHAKKELNFSSWHLSDINTEFFDALRQADLDLLPESVSKEEFQKWKKDDGFISKIIEPRISFAGKGYRYGFQYGGGGHICYNGKRYRIVCETARKLLSGVIIEQKNWEDIDFKSLEKEDFVYLDPPYFGTKASYPNIDHEKLIDALNSANCKWALSGYDNTLYSDNLVFKNKCEKERNSEIKSLNTRTRTAVMEILWTNY